MTSTPCIRCQVELEPGALVRLCEPCRQDLIKAERDTPQKADDVLDPPESSKPKAWLRLTDECWAEKRHLDSWQTGFIKSMLGRADLAGWYPSEKQWATLRACHGAVLSKRAKAAKKVVIFAKTLTNDDKRQAVAGGEEI